MIDLSQSWDIAGAQKVVEASTCGAPKVKPEDLLDRIKTLYVGLLETHSEIITQALDSQFMTEVLPSWTPRLSDAGILLPETAPDLPSASLDYLASLAAAATEVAFAGHFSSIVAGASSESDFMLDIPVYVGQVADKEDKEAVIARLGIPSGGPTNAELNLYDTEPDKPPHVVSLVPATVTVRSNPAHAKLVELLGELESSTRVEFEVITNGGKVPCFLLGKRKGEWLGLASCAVWT